MTKPTPQQCLAWMDKYPVTDGSENWRQKEIDNMMIEAIRDMLKAGYGCARAAQEAGITFRWYEDLHRRKPDHEKADRNQVLANKMELSLVAATKAGLMP
jgi:hypothetical protein